MIATATRRDDPLTPVSGRFTLSVSTTEPPPNDEVPSEPATRPFGLRFATPRGSAASEPAHEYCDERQIAVTPDEARSPVHQQSAGWTHTTLGSKDGQTPGQEDWKMDQTFADET